MRSSFFELSSTQAEKLLDIANVGRKDIFYDFGCGKGIVVRKAVTYSKVKKSIGIEYECDIYEKARYLAIEQLSKSELKKVDFWSGSFDDEDKRDDGSYFFDYSDATVIYNSLDETDDEINFYKKRLNLKKTKIVKKDLPFVSYEPFAVSRASESCWFFVMKYPFNKIHSKDKWAKLVLGKPDATIQDVYSYYQKQLEYRLTRKESKISLLGLQSLVRNRF